MDQSDGKLIAVREMRGTVYDTPLARHFSDVQIDPSLGTGGVVMIHAGPGEAFEGRWILLQSSGRTVVVARTLASIPLFRRLADGSPDPSFDTGGATTANALVSRVP